MAKERWFTGFEDANPYELSSASGVIMCDATARTGDFMARIWNPNSVGAINFSRALSAVYDCPSNGTTVLMRMQVAFRVNDIYPASRAQIFGFGNGTSTFPNQSAVCMQNADGTLDIESSNAGPLHTNFAPVFGKWYVGRLEYRYTRGASNTSFTLSLKIYDGANDYIIQSGPRATPVVGQTTQTGVATFSAWAISAAPQLRQATSIAQKIDYDDWWYAIGDQADASSTDLNWPTGTRVQAVPITGQGTSAAFTGDFRLAWDTPNSAVAGNEQTATVAGQTTTFLHQTAAELGLIPVGDLADATAADQAEAPPFSGLPAYEGITSGARTYCEVAQDLSLPTPNISQFQLTAGGGQFNSGVWVRAFTIEWRSQGASLIAVAGPMTAPVFFSAAAAPNFSALVDVTFNAATPQDRFLDPNNLNSGYRRYGLGLIVTNASNDRGLLNPFTNATGVAGTQTNTTNLQTYGGPGAIDAGAWGSLVALISTVTPNGTQPPYANTNPGTRPNTVTFMLSSPKPSGTSGGPTTTNLFGPIFLAPQNSAADVDLTIAEAIKVVAAMQMSVGSLNNDILIGGVATSVAVTGTFGGSTRSQFALDWTNRDAAAFDALQFGARAGVGIAATLRLGQCIAQVLTSGPCTRRTVGFNQYQHHCGIYTGNGAIQEIAVGFKPTVIIIKKPLNVAPSAGQLKSWWMGGTQSWTIDGVGVSLSTGIQKITDTGFIVGPDSSVNGNTSQYAYVAIRDGSEDTINDAYCITGSYYRQSTTEADQTVELPIVLNFAANWIPDVVLGLTTTVLKTPDMAPPNSDAFNTTNLTVQGVTAVGDRTYTTGTLLSQNAQHAYVAWRFDTAGLLEQVFDYGSFAGTNGAQTIPVNFMPELVFADTVQNTQSGRWRSRQIQTGANSTPWGGGNNTTIDITALGALSFDVGTGLSATGFQTYWLAWKLDGAIGNTGSTNIPPPSDTGDPTTPPDDDLCGGGGMHLPVGSDIGTTGCTAC